MNVLSSTIREILVKSEEAYGSWDAFRFKVKQSDGEGKKSVAVENKTYTDLKADSECFSAALDSLGEVKGHIAILGTTSYEWIVAYLGIVNSGSVAVPLDAQLPAEELCDLLNRAEVTTLVFDETKADAVCKAQKECAGLKHIISMKEESAVAGACSFWKLLRDQQPGYDYAPEPEELATIMFTSGTT